MAGLAAAIPAIPDVPSPLPEWVRAGVLRRLLESLAEDLRGRGKLDLSECFVDATFVSAKKGALPSAKPSGAKVRSSWQWQMALCCFRHPHGAC